ncbi:MAG: class I SAM-dependent methyltransferase [Bacteroidia bacterium]|nr:class I SAM-dependent methyltransferase [Bacteroidia bacterium]
MDKIYSASSYLRHKLLGATLQGIHSPFVFELLNKVIKDETPYYFYEEIESLRSKLLLNEESIDVTDFGTGGTIGKSRKLKISYISKHFLQPKRNAQLLSRLVTHLKPNNILELGTSLGISTLYLALADKKNTIITLEGCKNTAAIATKNFQTLRTGNITLIQGEFNESLPQALASFDKLDFVYFDGNHTKQATMNYFNTCLPKHHDQSIFIFDDIHWSREMSKAWSEIKKHPDVSISIDLYRFGLVFFRKGIPKQHFNLNY